MVRSGSTGFLCQVLKTRSLANPQKAIKESHFKKLRGKRKPGEADRDLLLGDLAHDMGGGGGQAEGGVHGDVLTGAVTRGQDNLGEEVKWEKEKKKKEEEEKGDNNEGEKEEDKDKVYLMVLLKPPEELCFMPGSGGGG